MTSTGISLDVVPNDSSISVVFGEKTSRKIQEIEKRKGLFGLSKKSKISYSGNSLIVRIPESIAKLMEIKREDEIIVHPEGKNKIAVELV